MTDFSHTDWETYRQTYFINFTLLCQMEEEEEATRRNILGVGL